MSKEVYRCEWAKGSALMEDYHDQEWGVPLRDDVRLFEYLVLDGFQAGLSWSIILRKREEFRAAFDGFDPERVAAMNTSDVERLMLMPGIVRNRSKITATISNATAYLAIIQEAGTFASYAWSFVGGKPIQNHWATWDEIPAQTAESAALSADLKARGFRFVGPTIIYAVMQSAGMVNDHVVECYRHAALCDSFV